jgi:uncharacterized repeat protein (TIGR01451 family)
MNTSTISRLAIMILLAAALIVIIPTHQLIRAAGPWYVVPGGNDSNSCTTPSAPCATINGALNKPVFVAGDTVLVGTGVYTGTGTVVVDVEKNAILSGGWNAGFTVQSGVSIIDGDRVRQGVLIGNAVATIERFVIRNGHAGGGGGGLYNWYSTVTLNNSTVIDNKADASGGGIVNLGTLILNNSTVTGNTAEDRGGGIYNLGTITLSGSTVRNNGAHYPDGDGGGISNGVDAAATLNNSTISDNTTEGYGGGIYGAGAVILNNSTVSRNTARKGCGGIGLYSGTNGNIALNNSTISDNVAKNTGGICNFAGALIMQNSILAGNAGGNSPDCYGIVLSSGYNLIGNTSGCDFRSATNDLINVDAKLGPLEGSPGYHPLLPNSPAVNGGRPAGCTDHLGSPLTTDERGFARFGRCDIGAYELQPIGFSTKTANASMGVPGQPLTYTIALANDGADTIANVLVTDTVSISLTYHSNSLVATDGTYGFNGGIITWTGSLNAQDRVTLTFGATVSQATSLGSIVNTAVISGGGEIINRAATFNVDGQVCNLTKYASNPVLTVGANGAWDDAAIWRPTVLKEGGTYKMWFSASDGTIRRIGYATSFDGIHWTKYGGNPVLVPGSSGAWDAAGVYAPNVIYDGGGYKMWYRGRDSSGFGRIGYATSPDGITWTRYGSNPVLDVGSPGSWDDNEVTEPTVIKEGNAYHLWYVGNDGVTLRIGHATSSDGINWAEDAANPVLDLGSPGSWDWLDVYSPSVVKVGDEYKLWYSGGTLPPTYQTGYATSLNGSTWTRQQKIIAQGPANSFDVYSADYPAVIVDGLGYKVWYSGVNSSGTYNIGYATVGVCSTSPTTGQNNRVFLPLVMKGESCAAYYTDNFNNPNSGWPVDDNSNRKYAYTDGQYQIWVKQFSQGWFATPGAKAADFTAVVSARRTSGTWGQYGILFGINEDWSQYYQFGIDGAYYSVWRYDGNWTALKDWTQSNYIATGAAWNRLKVVRNGGGISVYVNDHLLTTVTDSGLTGLRRIGLAAYSPDNAALDARFDDFSLSPASCSASANAASFDAGQFESGQPEIGQLPLPPRLPQH